jgi:hypothetical protein
MSECSTVDEDRARDVRVVPFDGRIDPASSPPSRLMRSRHVLRCSFSCQLAGLGWGPGHHHVLHCLSPQGGR